MLEIVNCNIFSWASHHPLNASELNTCFCCQFSRPKARDKKLQQEWVVPLKSVEDIQEVENISYTAEHKQLFPSLLSPVKKADAYNNLVKTVTKTEIQGALPWKLKKQSMVWTRRTPARDKDHKRATGENQLQRLLDHQQPTISQCWEIRFLNCWWEMVSIFEAFFS